MTRFEMKGRGMAGDSVAFSRGRIEFATAGGVTFARASSEPGWTWSKRVKPMSDSCQVPHALYQGSGAMLVHRDDGTEVEIKPGDGAHISAGHDAWMLRDAGHCHQRHARDGRDLSLSQRYDHVVAPRSCLGPGPR